MSRPLTRGETLLARGLFGDAIAYDRVRILTRPFGGWAVVLGSTITFPPSSPAPANFATQPLHMRAWLAHELTHVWQFQTAPLWTAWSWAKTALAGGYGPGLPGYRYPFPLPPWDRLNLEQQASVVEHAFVLRETGWCAKAPAGATLADYRACAPFEI